MATKFRQNKSKLHKFQLCVKIEEFFHMYGGVYRGGEFKYATWIFNGAKGVAMATKFG